MQYFFNNASIIDYKVLTDIKRERLIDNIEY